MNKIKKKSMLKRSLTKKLELSTKIAKNIQTNFNFYSLTRWNSSKFLSEFGLETRKTQITHKCLLTNNSKSFNKKFRLSRLEFFRKARSGKIYGVCKAVW